MKSMNLDTDVRATEAIVAHADAARTHAESSQSLAVATSKLSQALRVRPSDPSLLEYMAEAEGALRERAAASLVLANTIRDTVISESGA